MTPIAPPTASAPPLSPSPAGSPGAAWRTAMLPVVLLLIVAFFTVSNPRFIAPENLSNIAVELSITAVLSLGMLLVIVTGHVDLSVGSGAGLIGGIAAVLIIHQNVPAPLAMGVGLVAAVVVWSLMGAVIVTQRIPAFIITLGGLLIFRGLHLLVISSSTVPVARGGTSNLLSLLTTYRLSPAVGLGAAGVVIAGLVASAVAGHARAKRAAAGTATAPRVDGELTFLRTFVTAQGVLLFVLACNSYRGVPLPAVVLAVVAVAVLFLLRRTPTGRYLYAVGGNEEAAFVSGVPVRRVVIFAFTVMGLLTAVTGFLQTAYTGASTTTIGTLLELDAIAACVIGGVSLKGGRGTVGGVLLGSLIMTVLINGMTLQAYPPELKQIIRGTILALAVWADTRAGRSA